MDRLFLTVLNMSISASFCIAAVLVVRLLLKRAPKLFSYLLWAVVFIRLVCPVLPEAGFGMIPEIRLQGRESRAVEHIYVPEEVRGADQGISGDEAQGGFAAGTDSNVGADGAEIMEKDEDVVIYYYPSEEITETSYRAGGLDKFLPAIGWIWILGALGLILLAGVKYWIFVRSMEKKEVTVPFAAGILHPAVYLPEGLEQMQKQMVLEHENVHIKRRDYLVKPIAFLVCCIHWFNPLVWVSFFLMEKDMEASCDEAVLKKIGYDRRKDYANTLLALSRDRRESIGGPIAFGESNVKSRIKGVIKSKKAGIGVSIAASAVILGTAALLLVNRAEAQEREPEGAAPVEGEEALHTQAENITAAEPGEQAEPEKSLETEKTSEAEAESADDGGGLEGKETFSLPDIKEYLYFSDEDYLGEHTYIYSDETEEQEITEEQETIMNYNPDRVRDQFEVLNLPQAEEAFNDAEILFSYPVEADRISDGYGSRVHSVPSDGDVVFHLGVDFAAEEGTPVVAAADGTAVRTGFDAECGNYVILLHENGSATYYFHCQDILTEEGRKVKRGEQIATVGNTGKSTGAHLHFGVSRNGEYVEPEFVEE